MASGNVSSGQNSTPRLLCWLSLGAKRGRREGAAYTDLVVSTEAGTGAVAQLVAEREATGGHRDQVTPTPHFSIHSIGQRERSSGV